MLDLFLEYVVPAVPGLVALAWVAFRDYAARSDELWDDRVVDFIEEVVEAAAAKARQPKE